MHNPKQDIEEIIAMLGVGLKYDGHDRHKMRPVDRVVYWLTNIILLGGVAACIYFVIIALT